MGKSPINAKTKMVCGVFPRIGETSGLLFHYDVEN